MRLSTPFRLCAAALADQSLSKRRTLDRTLFLRFFYVPEHCMGAVVFTQRRNLPMVSHFGKGSPERLLQFSLYAYGALFCPSRRTWASRILFGRGKNSLDSPGGKVNGPFFRLPCNILRLIMVTPLGGADHISISVNLTTLSPSPTSRIHPLYQGTSMMFPGFTGQPISISVEPNSSWSTIVFGSAY